MSRIRCVREDASHRLSNTIYIYTGEYVTVALIDISRRYEAATCASERGEELVSSSRTASEQLG